MTDAIIETKDLGFPWQTLDPFLFCVYHKDNYPEGNERMEAPKIGDGSDFDWSQPYRMYHGERVPGFPQHPHRGFETVTATMEGLTDHTDSLGNAGRYGNGDLQWMTAGKGIVHGESFPLINQDKPNTLRLFQIWLNLPARSKMVPPTFVMHWTEEIPRINAVGYSLTLFAGEFGGKRGLPPPPDSWASDANNDVAVWHIEILPGGRVTLPPARIGKQANRRIYFFNGSELLLGARRIGAKKFATLRADADVELKNETGDTLEVLLLQGRPIGEPVAQRGPFVMNTQQEIMQAFADYQRTQFGGWPFDEDAVIHPREKGRFARIGGIETTPPTRQ